MRKQGEITVFLSMIIVCILSLCLGLLESARTAGARLYAQMAADSAMASVMSQYNRNLWDLYHLFALETESEKAVEDSFAKYLEFYLDQENLYPMKLDEVRVTGISGITENGAAWLEQGALSYMKIRMPDVAADLLGIAEDAERASKAGEFRKVFETCRKAGRQTRNLELCRRKAETSLSELQELLEELQDAVGSSRRFEQVARKFQKEVQVYSRVVNEYERELKKQDLSAYGDIEAAGKEQLKKYREMESVLDENLELLDAALELMEPEPDWNAIDECVSEMEIPWESDDEGIDWEKLSLLDRLEELFDGDLLELTLPEGTQISRNTVSLRGIPSQKMTTKKTIRGGVDDEVLKKVLVNEYGCFMFDSFLKKCTRKMELPNQPLRYEQEYLLCGKASDRENLSETVEKILAVRGAMNLLYLMNSPEKKAEADSLALAISGGNVPIQVILSMLILTLWAFGEAVLDTRGLMNGGSVPFWKKDAQWELSLEELLTLKFLDGTPKKEEDGHDYQDHLRVLYFLMDPQERNFRMLDVIQWNIRTIQEDFAVSDCKSEVQIQAEIQEHHLFLMKHSYNRTVETVGVY